MPGNSATVSIAIEVDDKGSVKIRQLGEAARKAGDEGARGFDAMGKSATGAERGINTMSTSLKALGGLAAAVAASAVVSKLVEIGRSAIQAASDMEQTQQKFDVVFRGMSSQAEAWATVLRDSFAMSALEAKNYMASIQNMLVPTGMAREEAGKLSFELTKLASDLASFNDKSTAQAFEDIMSALQGSSETMDKYGINVRESLVQQEAFTLGLARSKDEISQADRMLATYSLMIKQAGDAIGDTERSMASYALQQKVLHAQLEDFRIALGQGLLPVVNEMITGINNWMRENEGVLKQDLAAWAEIAAGALRGLMAVVHTLAEAYRGLKEAIVAVGVAEMNSGPAMMAEAGAQGVDKLVSNVNKVPGALANIKKAEEEIARIQANIAKQGFASEQQTAAVERLKGQIEGYRATIAAAEAPTTNTAAAVKVLDGSSKQAVASSDELARAAAGAAGAIDTKGASAGRAAKSLEEMAREDERIGRKMLADHAARVKATQELTDNLNEHARKGAEEKRKALADQLRLEYADEAANVDDKMKLEQDHADWVRGLQKGLLRDIEAGIGDFVYGFLTGEFDSIGDAFESLCDSILRAFANLIAEMVAKWAMSGIMGLFTGQGFGGFNMAAMGLGP
ncbi:MAG: hypothetical protein RBR18_14685, partial [Desulfovibrionaceae bacterium]|nr:hypothetical protein [Desulfovibrionaceae bacterium]